VVEALTPRLRARARIPKSPYRSKLEAEWALVLEAMKRDRQLVAYHYEPMSLRLGQGAFYMPDFLIVWHDGEVSFDEIKGGFAREASIVRIKVAASRYPFFRFRLVRKGKRGEAPWNIEEIK
jgi:hypothetical protein